MIIIKVKNQLNRFIKKCLKEGIDLYNIEYIEDYLIVKIKSEDYKRIKKINYYSEIRKIKTLGINGIILNLKKYYFDYVLLVIFLILIYFISNIVVKVEIKHENKELRDKVNEIIKEHDIKSYVIGKTLRELNSISDSILKNNRDILDWISINKIGMKYIVSFEERIMTEENESNETCHIIAKKDGVISKIKAITGISMFEIGDYVKKGDIIINGSIMLNDKNMDNICATGEVFAETWYKVNITYPFYYNEISYTNKSRINFYLNGNYLFKKNYKNFDEETLWNFNNFKIIKQREYIQVTKKYSKEEARKKALEAANIKLLEKIGKNNQIISQKVLKESVNNSKIELEVFISVNEQIGETELYEIGEEYDTEQSIRYNN